MFIYMSEYTNPIRRMKYVNMAATRVMAFALFILSTTTTFIADRINVINPDEIDIDWENDEDCLGI